MEIKIGGDSVEIRGESSMRTVDSIEKNEGNWPIFGISVGGASGLGLIYAHSDFLNFRLKVYSDAPEVFKPLYAMIKDLSEFGPEGYLIDIERKLERHCTMLAINRLTEIDPLKFITHIENAILESKARAEASGYAKAQKDIRNALGIKEWTL